MNPVQPIRRCPHAGAEGEVNAPVAPAVASRDAKVERGYPLIGVLPELARDTLGFVSRLARRHPGELVGFAVGPITIYLVTHPDHVQEVLVERWRSFGKGGMWDAMRPLFGNGVVRAEGDPWRRQRRMMTPLFAPAHLATLTDLMVGAIEKELTRLAGRGPGAVFDLEREMTSTTQRVLLEALFGAESSPEDMERLGDNLNSALRALNLRMFLYFLPERFPIPGTRQFRRSLAAIDEVTFRLVRARRASGQRRDDFLSLLLDARDEVTGQAMDDPQLRDEIVTMFVAGLDTTADAMTWLWLLLHDHPEIDRRLRAEVGEVLGERRPVFADVERLVYTRMVLQEAMRLYPPVWMFPRAANEDTVIGGCRVRAGSALILSPYVTHRDPAFWPDPERFDPERFSPERAAGRPRGAYFPFGGGPRICLGGAFAMMEAQLITAMMVQRFRPTLVPGHRPVPVAASSLKTRHGMHMTLVPG
jgi:cytochrome P450